MVQLKDIEWLNGYQNKAHVYAAYKRITSDLKAHQTESEWMGKCIPCTLKSKENWGSNTYV